MDRRNDRHGKNIHMRYTHVRGKNEMLSLFRGDNIYPRGELQRGGGAAPKHQSF